MAAPQERSSDSSRSARSARHLPRLRVVRVIARLNVGGPAKHVAILDAGLRDRGYSTLLLHGQPDRDEGSLAHLVHERDLPATPVAALGRQVRPWRDLQAFCTIARAIFAAQPDVVHTHTTKAGVVGRLAALLYNATRPRSRRCLVVHTYHGTVFSGYFGRVGSLLVRVVERMLGLGTDRIAVLSEQQRREIVDDVRVVPAGKVAGAAHARRGRSGAGPPGRRGGEPLPSCSASSSPERDDVVDPRIARVGLW